VTPDPLNGVGWPQPAAGNALVWPVMVMTVLLYAPALFIWRKNSRGLQVRTPTLNQNPLDLTSALVFGVLLTGILLLGEFLGNWLGNAGIYALAATSGIADVDAITLSLTRMSNDSLAMNAAVIGIVIAAATNNLVKSGMAGFIGNRRMGQLVGVPMLLSLLFTGGGRYFSVDYWLGRAARA